MDTNTGSPPVNTTHDRKRRPGAYNLGHVFTLLVLGGTDVTAGVLVPFENGSGYIDALAVIITALLVVDGADVRLGQVSLLTVELGLLRGHLDKGVRSSSAVLVKIFPERSLCNTGIIKNVDGWNRPGFVLLYLFDRMLVSDLHNRPFNEPRGANWGRGVSTRWPRSRLAVTDKIFEMSWMPSQGLHRTSPKGSNSKQAP